MNKYTVVSEYMATGEGRTISVWMGFADHETAAKLNFVSAIPLGGWYVHGADVHEGFLFDHELVKELVSDRVRTQMMDENCNRSFSAQLHYNYS